MTILQANPFSGIESGNVGIVDRNGNLLVVNFYTGSFLFLADHWIDDEYIIAGTTLAMYNWTPTPNVDPLDTAAVNAFYQAGPAVATRLYSAKPVTYWQQVAPAVWGLTGLGSDRSTYPLIEAFGVTSP